MTADAVQARLPVEPRTGWRVLRWEQRAEWPLAAIALAFLIAYAVPILHPALDPRLRALCRVVNLAAWVLFALDYAVRLGLARHRWHYWSRHLPDLAVIALPILRPLRLLRLVMLLKVLNRSATDSLRGRIAIYVAGASTLLIFCAALAVLDAERGHPGTNITTFGDALWWSAATVTTVGYGDRFPVTTQGRLVAAGLMVGGIALLGVITASIASWLIDKVREADEETAAATRRDVKALAAQVSDLTGLVRELRAELEATREVSRRDDRSLTASRSVPVPAATAAD